MTPSTARKYATFMLFATMQFVVLTGCAMVAYAGGTQFDPTTKHYGFVHNFFSDLGTTRAYSGHPNGLSCAMFVVALVSIGVAVMGFASTWRAYAYRRARAAWLGVMSQAFGIASGLGFVGIALTPWNLVLAVHNTLVLAAFSLLLGFVVCLLLLLVLNDAALPLMAAHALYLVVLGGYVVLLFCGPTLETPHGHLVQCAGQKVIVYTSMINLMFQSFTTRRLLALT